MAPGMKNGNMSTKELLQNRENVSEIKQRMKKVQVNLLSMNIPIKRRSLGTSEARANKYFIQDGHQQISVNPEVDKLSCPYCKPKKRFFKSVEILRYHLVNSHNLNTTSRHIQDPTISPIKINNPQYQQVNKNRIPVKLPSRSLEVLDSKDDQDEDAEEEGDEVEEEEEGEDVPPVGKSRNPVKLRRMRGKRNTVVNSRTVKLQPTCSYQTISPQSPEDDEEISMKDSENPPSPQASEPSDRKNAYEYYFSISPDPEESPDTEEFTELEEAPAQGPMELLVPSLPVQKSPPSRRVPVTPQQDQSKTRRRQSERKFEGLKPYRCNHCELSYSSLENKKLHEQTHTEKPEVCVYCEMRFYFPRSLRRHQRIHVQPVLSM